MKISNNLTWIIVGGLALFGLAAVILNRKAAKEINWSHTFSDDGKEPFDLFVTLALLRHFPGTDTVRNLTDKIALGLPDVAGASPANYIFIGEALYADSLDQERLLSFVKKGNTAFMGAEVLPFTLLDSIYLDQCAEPDTADMKKDMLHGKWSRYFSQGSWRVDSVCYANLTHPQLRTSGQIRFKYPRHNRYATEYWWDYFDTLAIKKCDPSLNNATALGTLDTNYVNFVKIPYGKGAFYLHTNPLFFTNYFMLDADKEQYAAKVFSHLSPGIIYWDARSRISRAVGESLNGNNKWNKQGPLQYILSQRALAYAWYIFLSLIFLYFIFYAKRRQRPIPQRSDKINASLAFVQTIGRMYFSERNFLKVAHRQLKHFRTFARERFNLTSKEIDEDFIKNLSLKSGADEPSIRHIASLEQKIVAGTAVENDLIELNQALQLFYQQSLRRS